MNKKAPDQTVRIVFTGTGRGLRHDALMLEHAAEAAGWRSELVNIPRRSEQYLRRRARIEWVKSKFPAPLKRVLNTIQVRLYGILRYQVRRVAVTVHVENIFADYISRSDRNWLLPNPEWFRPAGFDFAPFMDLITCKTHDACQRFASHHNNVIFSGFSNHFLPHKNSSTDAKDFRQFLHVAGNSRLKGTDAVVDIWSRHPEWPVLHVVIDERSRLNALPENIRVHEQIDDSSLNRLRDICGIVLAPSAAEGFGHVLIEGMASGSVVVTVDAPPMNELVRPDRGCLVPWTHSRSRRVGEEYFVDTDSLEAVVSDMMRKDIKSLERQGDKARQWVAENHDAFLKRFHRFLENELQGHG